MRKPKPTPNEVIAASLGELIDTISAFDRKTKRDEYTDVGEAWEIFCEVRKLARRALRATRKLNNLSPADIDALQEQLP